MHVNMWELNINAFILAVLEFSAYYSNYSNQLELSWWEKRNMILHRREQEK